MEPYSMIDQSSPRPGAEPALPVAGLEPGLEHDVAHSSVTRSLNPSISNPSVSAGIAAANALAAPGTPADAGWHASSRFPGEDGGHSLAEMAQRDLDAALQLLAERAQYITGASGAAIALRRDERNDMLCRASAGQKAPGLGALLSTESGLSGESVRTRMALRCDDAEHDLRVNQESCRELGIASVMIVPIIGQQTGQQIAGGDQVLGVFELFSDEAGAFGERDLSALQRLSEMVETAVKLARAAQIAQLEMAVAEMGAGAERIPAHEIEAETNLEINADSTEEHRGTQESVFSPEPLAQLVLQEEEPVLEVEMEDAAAELPSEAVVAKAGAEAVMVSAPVMDSAPQVLPLQAVPPATSPIPFVAISTPTPLSVPAKEPPAKRPLMWSAAVQASPDAPKPAEADQSNVPPMLRNLRKCKACGFPVSEGRTLCVECDEKQWRGQPLPAAAKARTAGPAVDFRQGGGSDSLGLSGISPKTAPVAAFTPSISSPKPTAAVPAAAPFAPQSLVAAMSDRTERETREEATRGPIPVAAKAVESAPREATGGASGEISASTSPAAGLAATAPVESAKPARNAPEIPNFSGGLGGSESWLAANKYVLGAILVIAAVVAAIAWLR
jgi:hypothetical protein